jgi:hypothetical protein
MIREQLNLFDTKYDLIDNKVDEFFWAYHAGMADGDGCFKIKGKSLCYQLSLIDKNIVKELTDLYGTKLGIVKKIKPHHSQAYIMSLTSNNAEHFFKKVYPYLIEKRNKVKKQAESVGLELTKKLVSRDQKFCWLAGYFDAEGCVSMDNSFDKRSNNYGFKIQLRFTSTDLKVNRYVRRFLNSFLSIKDKKDCAVLIAKTKWKKRTGSEKDCWDVFLRKAVKVFIFGKVMLPFIKVQRKIDKFKRIMDYAKFCARMEWQFGRFNFKTNNKMRKNYLMMENDN